MREKQSVSSWNVVEIKRVLEKTRAPNLTYFFIDLGTKSIEFSRHLLSMGLPFVDTYYPRYDSILKFVEKKEATMLKHFLKMRRDGLTEEPFFYFTVQFPDRMSLRLRCTAFCVDRTPDQPGFLVGTLEDVTREFNNTLIINACLDGSYVRIPSQKSSSFSGNLFRWLLVDEKSNCDVFEVLRDFVLPDDLSHYDAYVTQLESPYSSESSVNSQVEFRIRDLDESIIWVCSRNHVFYDVNNQPNLMIGGFIQAKKQHAPRQFVKTTNEICYLTGLPNQNHLAKDLRKKTDITEKNGFLLLIYTNIVNIMSTLGYETTNLFLKELACILKQNAAPESILYRTDNDCFSLLIPNGTAESVQEQMKRYHAVSGAPFIHKDVHYSYDISMAALEYNKDDLQADECFLKMSLARKKLKMEKTRQTTILDDGAFHTYNEKSFMEGQLRKSIQNNMRDFFLVYQPFVQASNGHYIGAEALLRWRDRDNNVVPPIEFIPILENSGLMDYVGRWVFQTAANQCKLWLEKGFPSNFYVSVNATAEQFSNDVFARDVLRHLKKIELPPQNITIEITESMLMLDFRHGLKYLNMLKSNGIRLAIDDFGTGYSSLSYLKNLPADKIKIDRSFIKDIEHDDYAREFVEIIIKIARSVGKKVCVEGVETFSQAASLRNMLADIFQGYLFGKPQPPSDFEVNFFPSAG